MLPPMERLSDLTERLRALPKGTAFTRMALAVLGSRGNQPLAAEMARAYDDTTPLVGQVLKAAVVAGTSDGTGWGTALVDMRAISSEFIGLVQPRTVLGRLPRVRRAPFNVGVLRNGGRAGAGWIGQGEPIPVGLLSLERLTLGLAKQASLVVVTTELFRAAGPAGEALLREELVAGIAAEADRALLDPTISATIDHPASLTSGAPAIASTGSSVAQITADLAAVAQRMIDAGSDLQAAAWALHPRTALFLSALRDTAGQLAFPTITVLGGTLLGLPALVSTAVPLTGSPAITALIALIDGSRLTVADDQLAIIDWATEAAVQMSDAPSGSASPMVSLWQNGLGGLRVTRFLNFEAVDASACVILTGVSY